MGGGISMHGDHDAAHTVLVGKPEEKRSLRRHGRKWEDNIKMGLTEIGVHRIHLSRVMNQLHAFVNAALNLRVA
jgi:hypothetical protein